MEYKHISCRIELNLHKQLKQEALNQNTSQQALINRYVAEGLAKNKNQQIRG